MLLYLIRHGETNWNVEGRMQGQTDIPLNENGIRLAQETARGMADIRFDLCITSPLKRARQTAEIILGDRRVPIREDWRIGELSFGEWEGLGCRAGNYEVPVEPERFRLFYTDPLHFQAAPGGESIAQLCQRTEQFWRELTADPALQDKTVLIATHGCAMRAILRNVYADKTDFWHGQVPVNCAVNIVEVKDGRAKLLAEDKIYYDPSAAVNYFKATV
ncbi:MAG: histidine phosphatase family protein [Eubacteriales bacterium]|nr:histidine phosphatase family protein [Eubacteriales bacterium]